MIKRAIRPQQLSSERGGRAARAAQCIQHDEEQVLLAMRSDNQQAPRGDRVHVQRERNKPRGVIQSILNSSFCLLLIVPI